MKRHLFLLCFTILLASLVTSTRAQDFAREGPKPVPPVASPAKPVPGSAAAIANDKQVLFKDLKALIFIPTPHDLAPNPSRERGVVLRGVTIPEPKDFIDVVHPYLGHSLTRGQLNTLIADIISYYRAHDRPVVDVIAPEQEITGGVLQIVILQGKVGKVSVAGNRWFSSEELQSYLRLQPGDNISARKLNADLDWVNQNPFHNSDVVYHPGKGLGETDIVLQTQDRFPARIYGGYEDDGNASTGFDRYEVGLNWGDAFHLGLGQQLNYQYTTSGDGQSLRSHSGSYIIPLPWRHTLTFFGSYADTKGVIPPLIGLKGRSYQISGRYGIPLPTLNFGKVNYKESFSVGFDYKYNNNSLEFGGITAGTTLVDVDQFVFGYSGTESDPYGSFSIGETLNYSPGNWGGNNNDIAFSGSHTGATSGYVYDNIALQRLTRLPWDFSLLLRGTLQYSDSGLTPSEQLGFGGYDTVRGYDEREANTDEGFTFTTELRTPPVSLGEFFDCPEYRDQLQFLGFWDYGAGTNHNFLALQPSEVPLSSVGVGVRYTINTYVSVRFDYGFQLLHTGLDNDQGSRSDLGVMISY